MHNLSSRKTAQRAATIFALGIAFTLGASAQNPVAPVVGGNGTFESQPGPNGLDAATARRRLAPVNAVPEDFSTLKIAPGFLIAMDVYDTPEYSLELRVDPQGNISVPMAGKIHIAEMTISEAAQAVTTALRDGKILNDPHVNLNVEEYAGSQVTVLGEVRTPGRVEMLAPRHLEDVIAMAGGVTEFAGKKVEIRHATGAEPRSTEITYSRNGDDRVVNEILVQPGDTITVQRAGIVYVLGGVTRPGGYVMQEDGELDVTQALALAYGTTMPAAVNSMRLIRKKDDGMVEQIAIPYRDMVKGKVAPLKLQAQDVIYVPISGVKVILGSALVNTGVAAAVIYNR